MVIARVYLSTGVRCFFINAYCGEQKGTVENTIGILRRGCPKSTTYQGVSGVEQK